MADIENALSRTSGQHRLALEWFRSNAGREVSWTEMKAFAEAGARLVNQAKGIYKPAYTDYALSVRQTLDSPYADRPVVQTADGGWIYPYYQELKAPAERDKAATNRGLMRCMEDQIPIGVLVQRKTKPGVTYDVLGLAAVTNWQDGYFLLHGLDGSVINETTGGDATAAKLRLALDLVLPDYNLSGADTRERRVAEVVQRRGQGKFRSDLIRAYGGRCAITGCDAVEALDAAHIAPYRGDGTNDPRNGLLLRADLHNLFDLGLLSIDADKLEVVIADNLKTTAYGELLGKPLRMPSEIQLAPSRVALTAHREWAAI